MRYVILKQEEIDTLEKFQKDSDNNTVRRRSQCLLLSHQKRTISDLSDLFSVTRRTIERWLDSWNEDGVNSLAIKPGRGVKLRLEGLEEVISIQLEKHNRNLKNVLTYLKKHHDITICKRTLQNFLKGAGL